MPLRCATSYPEPRPGGMADVWEPVGVVVNWIHPVDDSTPKLFVLAGPLEYRGNGVALMWGGCVTTDVYCTIGDLTTLEQRVRLKLLGVPRENKKARKR